VVKNFRLIVPPKKRSLIIEPAPLKKIPDIPLPKLGKRLKTYKPIPTTIQWRNWNGLHPTSIVSQSDYTQHRQQDIGRAIAIGKDVTNTLTDRTGDTWTFASYYYNNGQLNSKTYTVTWNGIGTPPAGVSTSTYSQGPSYYRRNGTFVQLQGKPDKFTWAVWFLVNGIPPDSQWQPIPSKNPNWIFEPRWVEYNLSLH
jgi:hypothetical protein